MRQNIVYKIYVGHKCAYIDATNVDLTATLRMHFFNAKSLININLENVSKIEYVALPSYADCLVYKSYLINLIKPLYNKLDKARDTLSENVILPELNFVEYNNPIVDKWKNMLKTEQISLFEEINK